MHDETVAASGHAGRLRAAGLRATRPRMLVLRLLTEAGGHRSVDEIVGLLAESGVLLPRASVYNVVRDLVDRGLLTLVGAGPGRALYEVSDKAHDHFACWECGRILDLRAPVRPFPLPADPLLLGSELEESLVFTGRCPACVESEPRPIRRRARLLRRRRPAPGPAPGPAARRINPRLARGRSQEPLR